MSSSDNEKYLYINSKEILQRLWLFIDARNVQYFHYDWALQILGNMWDGEFSLAFYYFDSDLET